MKYVINDKYGNTLRSGILPDRATTLRSGRMPVNKGGIKMDKIIAAFIGLLILFVIMAVVLALPVMLLWNAIVPDITNGALTQISFWQALGLNFLCAILFKNSSVSSKSE